MQYHYFIVHIHYHRVLSSVLKYYCTDINHLSREMSHRREVERNVKSQMERDRRRESHHPPLLTYPWPLSTSTALFIPIMKIDCITLPTTKHPETTYPTLTYRNITVTIVYTTVQICTTNLVSSIMSIWLFGCADNINILYFIIIAELFFCSSVYFTTFV